jgi:uncharacterized membrane protein (UPF0127 family)
MADSSAPERLRGLPVHRPAQGVAIAEADSRPARARGLGRLDELPSGWGLHIPRCRSVQTISMRFELDLLWLGRDGGIVRIDRGVKPRRVVFCAAARSVVEVRAGEADRFLAALAHARTSPQEQAE